MSEAQQELRIEDSSILMTIKKAFIELAMKANGKADLYFHSYFIETYLKSLTESQCELTGNDPSSGLDILNTEKHPFMKRILGLS